MLSLRPIEAGDQEFLCQLYASTRQEELEVVPWSLEEKSVFLRSQFLAQHTYYMEQFTGAQFDLILNNGHPIGRMYVDRRLDEIRLIDIAILPEVRGQGIGGGLLRALLEEAKGLLLPVRIHVESFNPALRLYQRLGFEKVEDQGVYYLMEWAPAKAAGIAGRR